MTAHILQGKIIAETIHITIRDEIARLLKQGHRSPGLAVILIGHDPASELYVRNKHKACEKVGIVSKTYRLSDTVDQASVLNLIDDLNTASDIDGILVQTPLPSHLDQQAMVERIHPKKDVDSFHPYNLGRLAQKCPLLRPCTPWGIIELLKQVRLQVAGMHAVVVGRSNTVGVPMSLELLLAGCTVTVCHRMTRDLKSAVQNADLLVAAVGHAELIKGAWIKPGSIVIDVGMNRMDNGSFVGDVEFETARQRAAYITPVPGGVGPMTVATLLQNTLYAYKTLHLTS